MVSPILFLCPTVVKAFDDVTGSVLYWAVVQTSTNRLRRQRSCPATACVALPSSLQAMEEGL